MSRRWQRSVLVLAAAAMLVGAGGARAESAGQEDLDKATQAKLSARTPQDFDEVIRLCESAQQKGLDADNVAFARQMLVATLMQRGLARAKMLEGPLPRGAASWAKLREFRDLALADLEKAVKVDPQQAEAWLYLARLNLLPDGDKKRAAEAIEHAIGASNDTPAMQAKALTLRAELEPDLKKRRGDLDRALRVAPNDADTLFAHGMLMADLDQVDAALADFKKLTEMEPDRPAVYEALAILLTRQHKFDQALVALDKVRELDPRSVHPILQQARIHILQANFSAALHALDMAVLREPENTDALLLRAEVRHELHQKEQALADVDAVLKLRPGFPGAIRLRAGFLVGDDKMEQALAELEALRAKNPKDLSTLLQLGLFYAADKRNQRAIDTYTAALDVDAKNFHALRSRGDLLLGIGKQAEALADYERAMHVDPTDPGLLNNLAWVLATSPVDKLRDGKRAIQLATDACKLTDFGQAHILSTLAAAYAETGDFKSAIEYSQRAVAAGAADQKEALTKELETYRAGKPTRELQTGEESKPSPAKVPAIKPPAKQPLPPAEKTAPKKAKVD